jgi:hypothetical protein
VTTDQTPLPLPSYGPTITETAFPVLLAAGSISTIILVFEEDDPRCSIQFNLATHLGAYIVDASADVKLFEITEALRFLKAHKVNMVQVDVSTFEDRL